VSALFGNACEYEVLGVLAMVFDGSRQFFDLDYLTFLFLSLVCVRLFGWYFTARMNVFFPQS
jgi:hypothetical protein